MAKLNKKGRWIGRPTDAQRFIRDGESSGNGLIHIFRCIFISIFTILTLIYGEWILSVIFIIPTWLFHFDPTDIMFNAFSWAVFISGIFQHFYNLIYLSHRIDYLRYGLAETIAVNIVSIITVISSFLYIYAYEKFMKDENIIEHILKDTPLRFFNIIILIIGIILIVYSWIKYKNESDFKLTNEEVREHYYG